MLFWGFLMIIIEKYTPQNPTPISKAPVLRIQKRPLTIPIEVPIRVL